MIGYGGGIVGIGLVDEDGGGFVIFGIYLGVSDIIFYFDLIRFYC